MARPGVYGVPGDRLSRLALLQQASRKSSAAPRETTTPPLMRLALAGIGGVFLLLAETGAGWAWLGAAAFMLSIAGATAPIGAGAGAVTFGIAYFRVLGSVDPGGIFWLVMLLYALGGAGAGALASLISNRLPMPAFAFLAALLPAGLEHFGSFGLAGNLSSTALTQYSAGFIVRMSRLGGLAGVTYVIFLFGAAVAVAVRYIRDPSTIIAAALPPICLVLVGLLYGSVSDATGTRHVYAMAFNKNNQSEESEGLFGAVDYNEAAWDAHVKELTEQVGRLAQRPLVMSAIERVEAPKGVEIMVWPEAAVALNAETKKTFYSRLESTARVAHCVQAAGYYDVDSNESKSAVAGGAADTEEGYARRRFVAGADDNICGGRVARAGEYLPGVFDTTIGRIGVLLSIDANFFENFKALSDQGAKFVAVCGYDDEKAPQTSVRLLVYNAARAGLSVVRATKWGTFCAVSPDGVILEKEEAPARADTTITVRVPLGTGRTAALSVGNAFAWIALFGGVFAGLLASSLPPPAKPSGVPRGEERAGPLTYRTKDGHRGV